MLVVAVLLRVLRFIDAASASVSSQRQASAEAEAEAATITQKPHLPLAR